MQVINILMSIFIDMPFYRVMVYIFVVFFHFQDICIDVHETLLNLRHHIHLFTIENILLTIFKRHAGWINWDSYFYYMTHSIHNNTELEKTEDYIYNKEIILQISFGHLWVSTTAVSEVNVFPLSSKVINKKKSLLVLGNRLLPQHFGISTKKTSWSLRIIKLCIFPHFIFSDLVYWFKRLFTSSKYFRTLLTETTGIDSHDLVVFPHATQKWARFLQSASWLPFK